MGTIGEMKNKAPIIGGAVAVIIAIGIVIAVVQGSRGAPEWIAIRDNVLPQFTTTDLKIKESIITRSFSPQIDIGFVVEADTLYQFISQEELDIWKIDEDTLYDTALRNLDKRSQNINVEVAEAAESDPTAMYVIVELDDGFSAVRLLSAGVRKAIAREVGNEYIAAIPTRDFLIFWHKDFPIFDAFAQQVRTEYETEEDYPLTPDLFRVNKYGIQPVKVAPKEEPTL